MTDAARWIAALGLKRHPEGGWYRETYRSAARIGPCCLCGDAEGARAASTAILYLLESGDFSALHRLRSDEIWHFHAGSPLALDLIFPDGTSERRRLGLPAGGGEPAPSPQIVIPAGIWFGAAVEEPDSFTLAGCTVSPGFEFDDFELASRDEMLRLYPARRRLIEALTRG